MSGAKLATPAVSARIAALEELSRAGESAVSWPALRLLGLLAEHHFRAAVAALEGEGHQPGQHERCPGCDVLERIGEGLDRAAQPDVIAP